jgi:hypothetical protein
LAHFAPIIAPAAEWVFIFFGADAPFCFWGLFFAFRQTEFAALRRIFFCSAIGGTGVFKMVNHHFGFFCF